MQSLPSRACVAWLSWGVGEEEVGCCGLNLAKWPLHVLRHNTPSRHKGNKYEKKVPYLRWFLTFIRDFLPLRLLTLFFSLHFPSFPPPLSNLHGRVSDIFSCPLFLFSCQTFFLLLLFFHFSVLIFLPAFIFLFPSLYILLHLSFHTRLPYIFSSSPFLFPSQAFSQSFFTSLISFSPSPRGRSARGNEKVKQVARAFASRTQEQARSRKEEKNVK